LILVAGFIHDVSTFFDQHPGGVRLLGANVGKDATAAFFGGYYAHSNAAHNVSISHFTIQPFVVIACLQLLSMMRVGVLDGGMEIPNQPTSLNQQKLFIERGEK